MCSEAQWKLKQCQNNFGCCGQVCCPNTSALSQKAQNIITANIAGLQENVLTRLPNIETIRRNVRRNRSNNHPAVPDIYDT